MKKIITLCILLGLAVSAYSQAQLSVSAGIFLREFNAFPKNTEGVPLEISSSFIKKYDLYSKRGSYYIGITAVVDQEHFDASGLEKFKIILSSRLEQIVTLRVPVQYVDELIAYPGVLYLETGTTVGPDLERSLASVRADSVHSGLGGVNSYRGKGVIVGVIDWGFDYTHPVFYDTSKSKLRIARAWDQNKMSGPDPEGYDFGTEYIDEQQLLAAGADTLYVFGPMSHGTHVAGIAGGAGGGTNNIGIAPESELILISLRRDDASYIDAIKYISDYADAVGKPFVVNMSFGNHIGPHDGTALRCMATDILAGKGKVFVGSAGNNGNNDFHIQHQFPVDGDTLKTVPLFTNMAEYYGQSLSIWGTPDKQFQVAFRLVDGTNSTIFETPYYSTKDQPSFHDTLWVNGNDTFILTVEGQQKDFLSGKPSMLIDARKISNLKLVLLVHAEEGDVHVWHFIKLLRRHTNWGSTLSSAYPGATGGNDKYGLGEPNGVGNGVITVASYRGEVVLNGNTLLGQLSYYSSKGPTVDQRVKPDIAGPGQDVLSSVNSFDPNPGTVEETVNFKGKDYHFVRLSGTSMSGPAVAGVVALMLQANPNLTAKEVKEILKQTARLDQHTGAIDQNGNVVWGWGKVNALAAVRIAELKLSGKKYPAKSSSLIIYPNPATDRIHFRTEHNIESVKIFSLDGKLVLEKASAKGIDMIKTVSLKAGSYLVECCIGEEVIFEKLVKQ